MFNALTVSPTIGTYNTSTYNYTVGATGNYLITINVASTAGISIPMLAVNGANEEFWYMGYYGVSYWVRNAWFHICSTTPGSK